MDETQDAAETEAREPEQEPDYKALYEQAVQEKDDLSRRLEDSKKHSRKWESAAKKQSRTIDERVAALEQENADLKARAARDGLVKSVAKETGCPEALVAMLSGGDEESLTEQAKALAEQMKPPTSGAVAPEAGHMAEPGKPTKESILSIKDSKKRKAAIAANIDLF